MFFQASCNCNIGYASITLLQLLAYIYETYAQITEADLEKIEDKMKASYDVNHPIENF